MKWITILFTLFIVLIIVLANMGMLGILGALNRIPYGDKAGHFILYGILTFLLDLTLVRSLPHRSPKLVTVSIGLTLALLIGLEEFSQQYFPNRTFDLVDLAFSYLGVFFFSWVALNVKKTRHDPYYRSGSIYFYAMVEWKTMITLFQDKRMVILWAVILFGVALRSLPALQVDFPLNDGGMFLSMIRDLRANHYLIPATTSYNYSDIPYAYPPLGMYAAAILSGVFSISDIAILRWLPAIVSAAIIPAFYWLSLVILGSKPKTFIAVALYAVLPGSFDWLVMGGGLTRSFGILFSLLAFGHVYQLFRDGLRTSIWRSILFCVLAVLSHPEVGLQTAAICCLMWLFFGRSPAGLKNAILVSLGTVLLTAPWWLTVLIQHGSAPFESAMQTGIRETLLASLFHSFFSMQGSLPILPMLSLLGIWVTLRKKDFLLFAWAFAPFFVDPRNAPAVATFPFIMLSSEGLYFLKEEFERAYFDTVGNKKNTLVRPTIWTTAIFSILLIYLFIISFNSTGNLPRISLKETDRETMTWIKTNLPVESRFLLITNAGQISPMADSYQEWFPVLAERQSRNTLQGSEWTLGSEFFPYSQQLLALQSCPDADCLHEWAMRNPIQVEYVLIQAERASPDLIASLRSDEHYQVVYESATAVIFKFIQ